MITLNHRFLKVHQTARSRSLLSIRLTSPMGVLFSQVTIATVIVKNAKQASHIVHTRLHAKAKTATMFYA